ncbi:hypothetical protein HZS_850 [Henneguya salminicola]|nr:hypothetical protein HZS_850 [Henneguya salminicola]
MRGWPAKSKLGINYWPLYEIRSQLSFEDGILLWRPRICIPKSLQPTMLKRLHEGHTGMTALKSNAKLSQNIWPKEGIAKIKWVV